MPAFVRYIDVDDSGARTPTASLEGLRVYLAEGDAPPVEVLPPPSPRKYWTRRGIAEWLIETLAELRYYGLTPDWPAFHDDFQRHWPTDEHIYVDFVHDGAVGKGRRVWAIPAGGG
jgi:hypothetical protein